MSFILVAPLKHIVNWKRSPIFRIKETQVISHPYENYKFENPIYSTEIAAVEPENIDHISKKYDIPTIVFKGCPNHVLNSEFTAENVIFEDCDAHFIYYNMTDYNFPNVKNIYLPSDAPNMNLLSSLLYLPKPDTKMTESLTIFIKQQSNDKYKKYEFLTNKRKPTLCKSIKQISLTKFEETINNLCRTMIHPDQCIYKNSSTLKMNSRYSS